MTRAVRFNDYDILKSPHLLASPHHANRPTPKGILLESGTFEKKTLKNGRHQHKPPKLTLETAESSLNNPSRERPKYRSRRRSMPQAQPPTTVTETQPAQLLSLKDAHSSQMSRQPLIPLNQPSSEIGSVAAFNPKQQTLSSHRSESSTSSRKLDDAHVVHSRTPSYGMPDLQGHFDPDGSISPQKSRTTLRDVVVNRRLAQPRILWNVAYAFQTALFPTTSKLRLSDLDSPATTPALDKIAIRFNHSRVEDACPAADWGSIKIRGSFPVHHEGATVAIVTVRDVVNAVFEFLQAPLTREEYASVKGVYASILLGAQRKRLGSNLYQIQGYGNPLRVDVLGELTRFEGVSITSAREKRLVFGLDLAPW
ncbi:hypothetical protein FA15DRAFT_601554 [Coprinopsis marcescibilis]|uniref:DUF6699 domain-containing protein n=1 Tax=Coprinopsis marcescibilis TaxID=230819 RepID=A0A5C3KI02_COPMA|nr:hypothetical protein FA15DRAFT_601554 [Coprinopsis marcescibilis]